MGRFIAADVIGVDYNDPQSLNRFSYVRNNPIIRLDPSGHCDWCEELKKQFLGDTDNITTYGLILDLDFGLQAHMWDLESFLDDPVRHLWEEVALNGNDDTWPGIAPTDGRQASGGLMLFVNTESKQLALAPFYAVGSTPFATWEGASAAVELKAFYATGASSAASLAGSARVDSLEGQVDAFAKFGLSLERSLARNPNDLSKPFLDPRTDQPVEMYSGGLNLGANLLATGAEFKYTTSEPQDNRTWTIAFPPELVVNWYNGR